MCGIAGIISLKGTQVLSDELKRMTDIISHRGPDGDGQWISQSGMVGFSHRRLSIIDLSEAGSQPMSYLINKYTITYNGEIYNYLELKDQLVNLGYTFTSKTDTEVILAAYDYWGHDCTNHFNGMWAFAIYDKPAQIVFCSRDRFGVKPFYYFKTTQYFTFGSEIKQFTVLNNWSATLNTAKAIDFLIFSTFDHTSETLFKNVYQLRGGQSLIFDLNNKGFEIKQWYNLNEQVKLKNIDFEQAKTELKDLFENAVKLRLRSDVKVGSCLSGGIDSSAIVCIMNNLLNKEDKKGIQEVVSSCFKEKKYDEQEFIDEVVTNTGVKANKIYPNFENLFNQLQHIIWHQDEPFGSTSIFAQWNVFEEAKNKGLKVMLDGQGADESLAGYPYFQDVYNVSLLRNLKLKKLASELKSSAILQNGKRNNNEFIKLALKSYIPHDLTANLRRRSSSHELKYVKKSFKRELNLYEPNVTIGIKSHSLDLINISHLPMLLHYEDRDSMAHSIESRVPFLDYRLMEFILSLPDEFKIKDGISKFIFREAMTGILPDKIKNRYDKMGFVTPEQLWIIKNKNQFREYLQNAVSFFKPILHADTLLSDFDLAIAKKTFSFGSIYWRIIALHQWVIKFNVDCFSI